MLDRTSAFWSIRLAHTCLTFCNIILSVCAFCCTTHHCILKQQFLNCASWNDARHPDFQDLHRSHYSHQPQTTTCISFSKFFTLSVLGALNTSVLPRVWGLLHEWIVQNFSAIEFVTEQESCSCLCYFCSHGVLF